MVIRLCIGLWALMALAAGQMVVQEKMSDEECAALGYNTASLKCSVCDLMPQFNLDALYSDCAQCCKADETRQHEKYAFAQIEICECNLQRFPQVNAFVKSDLSQQWGSRLKIRHVRGVLPTIVLKSADGQSKKSLNIEKWDTDTITEFINDWLE